MEILKTTKKEIQDLKLKYILRKNEKNIYSIILIENGVKKININVSENEIFAYNVFDKLSTGLVTSTCFYEILDEIIE